MTTTDTVMCMIPLSAAAAPRKAYVPGVIHGMSGSQVTKNLALGYASCNACTRIPTIRPKDAPMAIEGTKMPAGTLQPYEIMTKKVRTTVANSSEKTMVQRFFVLHSCYHAVEVKMLDQLTRRGRRSHACLRIPGTAFPSPQSCQSSRICLDSRLMQLPQLTG